MIQDRNPFKIQQAIKNLFVNLGQRLNAFGRKLGQRKNWPRYALYIIGSIVFLFLFLLAITWAGVFGKIPRKEAVKSIRQPEASKIYSADEKLIDKYYTKNRNTLAFEDMPPEFMSSLIATEDSRFWSHNGI